MYWGEREVRAAPEWLAVKAFAAAILIGTLLLSLPAANARGLWTAPLTALFTATSATCVTGLIVVDTGSHFSPFGQSILLALIQLGGLGIMTLGTFLLTLAGRRLRMQDEFVLRDSLGNERVRGLKSLLGRSILFTFLFEAAGTAVLAARLITHYHYAPREALCFGVFHAVSAFCNAGFSLYADSLMRFQGDPVIVLTTSALVILGGLGFIVLFNFSYIKFWRRDLISRERITLHARIVLAASTLLVLWGWAWFLLLEWNHTLDDLGAADKILCALFQSVTPRTAGFNVVDTAALQPATLFHTMGLMFVGGSPASTAGGIKTTTLVVLVLTVVAMVRGRPETHIARRTIPAPVVREALSIVVLSMACLMVFFSALLLTESRGLLATTGCRTDDLLFETVSAFATVGLSTGITAGLSAIGKLILVVCMFVGRLGPLTIALIIGTSEYGRVLRYPDEEVIVG